jgi:hypothetical protein
MRFFYFGAMLALAAGGTLVLSYAGEAYIRRGVLLLALGLIITATILQMREKCPRCGVRLKFKSGLTLPPRCRRCGVLFPPAPERRIAKNPS